MNRMNSMMFDIPSDFRKPSEEDSVIVFIY